MKSIKTGSAMAMLLAAFLAACVSHPVQAETAIVSTLAGSEEKCFADVRGSAVRFLMPFGIAIDAAGNLYVVDVGSHILKVTPKREVSALAGGDSRGYADGQGSAARFDSPIGIVIDAAGNLYVADAGNYRIRKVTPKGEVSTLAGSGPTGYRNGGYADGQGSEARFSFPSGIAIDTAGNLYVADKRNNRIRKITPGGEVSTLAGGEEGFSDGQGSAARFNEPSDIAIDAAGNLYVTDTDNHSIRKITPKGEVSTLAGGEKGFSNGQGSAARFSVPFGIVIDSAGNLYVADKWNNRIRKVTQKGEVSTLAGDGEVGFVDGEGSAARFANPNRLAIDAAGNLYVTDGYNSSIRKVTPNGEVSTLVAYGKEPSSGPSNTVRLCGPCGLSQPQSERWSPASAARFCRPCCIAID